MVGLSLHSHNPKEYILVEANHKTFICSSTKKHDLTFDELIQLWQFDNI